MIIEGYHGTSEENATKIIKNNEFVFSVGDEEWLGKGIYFYCNYEDAINWAKRNGELYPCVLHTIIEVDKDKVIDFDTEKGKEVVESYKAIFIEHNLPVSTTQKNQCALMNLIWDTGVYDVLIGSFASKPSLIKTLTDGRKKRREFCIRDNGLIKILVSLGG